jgi:hypothetical protein
VISTDTKYTGAGNETPPAVGACWGDQVVLMAPVAAPVDGTGLPLSGQLLSGSVTPIRLRGLTAAAGTTGTTTGAFLGATARPSVQTPAPRGFAVAGVPAEHTSSTPGDLPPEDRLS